jgi:spermidine export protein MdtJ
MNAIIQLAIAGIMVALGDLALAQWAKSSQVAFLLIGVFSNILGIITYARVLSLEHIGVATAVFLGLNILIVAFGSFLVFGESISAARAAGLAVIATGIVLVEVL